MTLPPDVVESLSMAGAGAVMALLGLALVVGIVAAMLHYIPPPESENE